MLKTPLEKARDDEWYSVLKNIKAAYVEAGVPNAWILVDNKHSEPSGHAETMQEGRAIFHSHSEAVKFQLAWQPKYSTLARFSQPALAQALADGAAALALPEPQRAGLRRY